MEKEVQKYFMTGTDEEVLIGDVISVELEKDFGDGRTLTRQMEFKVTEETIPEALELGIIEEKTDCEDDDDLIDFKDEMDVDYVDKKSFQEFTHYVSQDIEEIRDILNAHLKRLEMLEEDSEAQARFINKVKSSVKSKVTAEKPKKTASSRKKK